MVRGRTRVRQRRGNFRRKSHSVEQVLFRNRDMRSQTTIASHNKELQPGELARSRIPVGALPAGTTARSGSGNDEVPDLPADDI